MIPPFSRSAAEYGSFILPWVVGFLWTTSLFPTVVGKYTPYLEQVSSNLLRLGLGFPYQERVRRASSSTGHHRISPRPSLRQVRIFCFASQVLGSDSCQAQCDTIHITYNRGNAVGYVGVQMRHGGFRADVVLKPEPSGAILPPGVYFVRNVSRCPSQRSRFS